MFRLSGHLDPEAAAVLSAALDPLSAPNPNSANSANGGRDPRAADRRRADALIEICRRATAAGGQAPTTTKAQVVVLIDLDRLTDAIRGAGLTLDGQVLSPQTVRKLGCDASIIPIVLGSQGQPLDVGRTKRLVTPALLSALWVRDKHCTYPRCGRPPTWCDAHHAHPLGQRRTHRTRQPRTALRPPSHPRPPTQPDRHHHRARRHLANLSTRAREDLAILPSPGRRAAAFLRTRR